MEEFYPGLPVRSYISNCIKIAEEKNLDELSIQIYEGDYDQIDESILFPENIKNIAKNIKKLSIDTIFNITKISHLSDLINVQEVFIDYPGELVLDELLNLPKLKKLKLGLNLNNELPIETLKKLVSLDELEVNDYVYNQLINSNLPLKNVKKFTIDIDTLNDIPILQKLTNIEELIFISYAGTFNSENFKKAIHSIKSKKIQKLLISLPLHNEIFNLISELNTLKELEINSYTIGSGDNKYLDISEILKLTNLEKLEISAINYSLKNINHSINLPNLKSLKINYLKYNKIIKLIKNLPTLEELQITLDNGFDDSENFLEDLKHLKNIKILQIAAFGSTLELTSNFLEHLTKLEYLRVSGRIKTESSKIKNLLNLKSLHLSNFKQCYTDVDSLTFPKVTTLTLQNHEDGNLLQCFPNIENLITDLSPHNLMTFIVNPGKITNIYLVNCDNIYNLEHIEIFPNIEKLSISDSSIESIKGIEELKKIKFLEINGCDNLINIEPLLNNESIIKFELYFTTPISISWNLTQKLFLKNIFTTYDNEINCEHVPNEITTNDNNKNIELWYNEIIKNGYSIPSSVKVMILGNGRIGKTQLSRRLRGERYDDTISSTHGIDVFNIKAKHNSDIKLQTWDFGGQDVYLGTHSLFIDKRAVYLLLWTPSSENTNLVECEEIAIRNRPLSYWLAYLKSLAGENANVLICQSQCDNAADGQTAPIPQPNPIKNIFPIPISTKTDNGLNIFEPSFNLAIERQLQQNGEVWIPNSWLAIEEEICKLAFNKVETLEHSEFLELCETHNVLAPETLASYLHQAGVVFYRPGSFSDKLILDQQWALQGVYLLLHREDALPNLMQMDGKFDSETIERLLWKNSEKSEDTQLFIEMMNQCGACFSVDKDIYIAPDALPEKAKIETRIEQIWQDSISNYHVRLHYDFLHDATMRYLLSKIGTSAKAEACYWKYGCCYYDSKHKARVLFDCCLMTDEEKKETERFINYGQPGYIDIKIKAASSTLVEHLVYSITKTNHLDAKATVEWIKGEPKDEKEKEKRVEQEQKEPFSNIGKGELDPNRKPNVYFSYAWGKDANDPKQIVCDEIYGKLKEDDSIKVFRDRDSMSSGDSIEAFEKQIGRADYVLMIISEKSLYESEHCMNELRLIFERSQQDRQDFVGRVIPVVMDDANIKDSIEILTIVDSWMEKKDKLQSLVDRVGTERAGSEVAKKLRIMTSFINSTSDALHWIADLVIDRTEEFQADTAVELLKKRIAESNI